MINMRYFFTLSVIVINCISCINSQNNNCKELQNQSHLGVMRFFKDENKSHLDSSLDNIEKSYKVCPELETAFFPNIKVTILILLKEYDKGYEYIKTFNDSHFMIQPYSKNSYLNIFSALIFREQKDTFKVDSCVNLVLKEFDTYLIMHPDEEQTVIEAKFQIKYWFQNKSKVMHEIEELRAGKIYDNEFIDNLINSLMTNRVYKY
jgi:hypothetical protein